jgi:hypothetical protein
VPGADSLFELVRAGTAATVAETTPLVAALLASETYRNRHRLVGRATLPDERVAALLTVLVNAHGRARMDTVAAGAGIPAHRIHLTVTALRRLLQIEGYPVLDIDADGQTLVLDERLLREQFRL